LVDANGKDLLDGADRSALLARLTRSRSTPLADDPVITKQSTADGKYHLIAVIHDAPQFQNTLPTTC